MTALTSVRVVGAVLPADVITRALTGDLPGLTPDDYHLPAGEQVRAAAARCWPDLTDAYAKFRHALGTLPPGQHGTADTRDKWLQQVLKELGYGRVPVTPGGHLTAGLDGDRRTYPVSHAWADVPIHLLGWGLDLDRPAPGVPGAARAPQSMVQEFLNRSDDHLWGLLSNGRTLRLLRDSTALVGQAYVEFDLEAMFDGEVFSDFVALFLLCHQSRLERLPGPDGTAGGVADRWLERWRSDAVATGTRALTAMRRQVEQALEVLGTGFYAANPDLRARLSAGALDTPDYQRALLRVLYRLLFWFVAEDRNLLLPPDADPLARARYERYFSSARLRRLAARKAGTRHHDLWQQVELVLAGLGTEHGRPELGLPPLGGLFDLGHLDVLAGCRLPNTATLHAVRLLSRIADKRSGRLVPVDFQHLGAEELGGIYEGLLELHPRLDPGAGTFTLEAAAGNERKTSGSYYTPAGLIALVLDEALDPVLDEAETGGDPEAALLAVTVCDPACGSGHFLVAAAIRIARRLAQHRSGESEPTQVAEQAALRDVVLSCIHGVDVNPMAAELAKVSLWLQALEPGKPLAFLDANIRVGNALLGVTPRLLADGVPDAAFAALTGDDRPTVTALRRRNRTERASHAAAEAGAEQLEMLDTGAIPVTNAELSARLAAVASAARGSSLVDVHLAARRLAQYESAPEHRHAVEVADAWCAAFTQPKTEATAAIAVTDAVLRRWAGHPSPEALEGPVPEPTPVPEALEGPVPEALEGPSPEPVDGHTRALVAAEARRHRFFHWHLEFPRVFRVSAAATVGDGPGWEGGFTVMVGNPPWETVQLTEREFFADRAPEIAASPNAAARRRLIEALEESEPVLYSAYRAEMRRTEAENHLARGGRFPLTARGKINTYALFAETFRDFIAAEGRCGFITPTGLATDATTAPFFADTLRGRRLAAFYDFENEAKIFPGVHHAYRFAVSAMTGRPVKEARFAFLTRYLVDVPSRRFDLAPDEVLLLNPNTGTLPVFRTRRDAEITLGIYRRHPVLVRDDAGAEGNPWGLAFKQGLFNMAGDSGLFRTEDDLAALGAEFDGWAWLGSDGVTRWLPLYEAKLLTHWDHRFSTYRGATQAQLNVGSLPRVTDAQHDDPSVEPLARYWVEAGEVAKAIGERSDRGWLFGWRDIARASDVRTMVPSVLPRAAVGNKFPLVFPADPGLVPCLQAVWSSLAFDYVARQKLSGTGMTYFILKQIACPPPSVFADVPGWLDSPLGGWVSARVLELTYTSYRIAAYARDLGDTGEPFRWVPERRAAIRAELDAAMMHVYGLDRDEAEHVLDSFPVLRRYEEAPVERGGCGEFRTRRLVLATYDLMADAARTGRPHESPITPAPGHGPRHPPAVH